MLQKRGQGSVRVCVCARVCAYVCMYVRLCVYVLWMEINLYYAEFSPACLSQSLARLHETYQDGQAEIQINHLNDSPSRLHTLCLCNPRD